MHVGTEAPQYTPPTPTGSNGRYVRGAWGDPGSGTIHLVDNGANIAAAVLLLRPGTLAARFLAGITGTPR